jgi:hypothetical protein
MTKKIEFQSVRVDLEVLHPIPAFRNIPEWFRKIPGVIQGMDTIKKCVPFLDAYTTGYLFVLAADVYFDKNGIQEITKEPMIVPHRDLQIQGFEPPKEYNPQPLKWINLFISKTPRGYSTIFTHPLNRIDLPFYTLTGIVDTDKHPVAVNFPFFIKKDFEGIIPAGTPIAQAIPFKRQNWEHSVEDKKQAYIPAYIHTMHNPPFGFYKKHFWSKKTYK